MQSVELARTGAHGNVKVPVDVTTDLDTALPRIAIAPRDVARALLNIIGNGVTAAVDRAAHEGHAFQPQVAVTTRHVNGSAIVRVRDNERASPGTFRSGFSCRSSPPAPAGRGPASVCRYVTTSSSVSTKAS